MSTYGTTGTTTGGSSSSSRIPHISNNNKINHHQYQYNQDGTTEQDRLLSNNNTNHNNKSPPSTLSSQSPTPSRTKRFSTHLTQKITPNHTEYILLLCYIITGLLDSSATAIWGAFVSMQTGNSIYLGLGIADPNRNNERNKHIKALISILSFCLGSFCFSRFHRMFGPKKRWVLMVSFAVQIFMIVVAAVVVIMTPKTPRPGDGYDLDGRVLVPLAMAAFQSSGQAVTSRAVEHGSLTSVVLTSIYCDLFSDKRLFVGPMQNVTRNRRLAAPVLLLAGAVLGGFFSRQGQWGVAGALWVAAGMKSLIVVAWLFWSPDDDQEDETDED